MKKLFSLLSLVLMAVAANAVSQYKLTLSVSSTTGVSVAGLKAQLSNELYGIEYPEATVAQDGTAKFTGVVEGTNTLTIDATSIGLEKYVDQNLVVSSDTTVAIILKENTRTPYNLQATLQHNAIDGTNTVALGWNQETDYFFDDFEGYEAFSIDFAPWTGYDGDKEATAVLAGTYMNAGLPQYATIFNLITLGDTYWYEYPVLRPYSGKQCLGFVRTASGSANNDWAITPKIKVGVDNVVSFLIKGSDTTKERYNVGISTTGTDTKDFTMLTSGNYQTVGYEQWQELTFDLSAYEGQEVYIAIQCVSSGGFMLMVDDFYVGPYSLLYGDDATAKHRHALKATRHRSKANPNETFNVYQDDVLVGTTADYAFTVNDVEAGTHVYAVEAKYLASTTEKTSVSLNVPDADSYAKLSISLTANTPTLPTDIRIELTSKSTGDIYTTTASAEGYAEFLSLPKDDYLMSITSTGYDTIEETVCLTEETSLSYNLFQTITAPYNLQATQTTVGDHQYVNVVWNTDLGFSDSFEDYEDFAQQFGDWITIDGDQMKTYTMSINGTIITTPEQRGLVGAMIFNPEKTEPVKASEDGLFTAPDGLKYILFSSAEQAQSDDWLISPTLTIGQDYVVRFTAKSYSYSYPGTLVVGVMKQGDTSTFQALDEILLTSDWTRYELSLAAYADGDWQVAVHHTSYDMWISMLDDFYVGPTEEEAGAAVGDCTYRVYLDSELAAETSETSYTFTDLAEGTHTIGVQAVYATGVSSTTEIDVTISSGIRSVTVASDGIDKLFDLSGRALKSAPEHGVYLKNGRKMVR